MFCEKCGNELKDGENVCSKCGYSKQKKKGSNKKIVIIVILAIIIIAVLVIGGIFLLKPTENTEEKQAENAFEQIGTNGSQVTQLSEKSFATMAVDDSELNLTDEQKEVLKYFDNDYFSVWNCEFLQRYPKIYKGAQLEISCSVAKVIKSTNEEFEALMVIFDGYGDAPTLESTSNIFVLKTKQLDERLIEGDSLKLYGRYTDIGTYEVDGKSYTVPVINAINIVKTNSAESRRFDLDTITTVAKYIFGNDIKIRKPVSGTDFELGAHYIPEDFFYLVTLDNQSNANFKAFDIHQDYGYISYNYKHNDLPDTVEKRLFISADFNHFIVSTYDSSTSHLYIDYFNDNFEKLWGREFSYNSNESNMSPMDYTAKQMAFVIDNDLYLIDLETGENVIDPVLVGSKLGVVMLSDGILLIGDDTKDTIMKVSYDGQIIYKTNIETEMDRFNSVCTQIVDGKMVICISGQVGDPYYAGDYKEKYIVLNDDGSIELETEDISIYAY